MFSFPNPVNEVASRVVASGVVVVAALALALQLPWVSAILAYGFLARVATGPRLSPLGQLATRWVAPRLSASPRLVPGPPKRFAQGIGALLTVAATAAWFGFHSAPIAYALLAVLLIAAFLEAALAFCLGCWLFSRMMAMGLIPASVCASCMDISRRRRPADA